MCPRTVWTGDKQQEWLPVNGLTAEQRSGLVASGLIRSSRLPHQSGGSSSQLCCGPNEEIPTVGCLSLLVNLGADRLKLLKVNDQRTEEREQE